MSGSTSKKVVVRRFDREPLAGFVNPQTWLQTAGFEMLSTSGALVRVPYGDVKTVEFVRDFDLSEPSPGGRLFASRPKTNGIWVRLFFRDGGLMDGILANDLLHMEPQGFTVAPPNPGSRSQRIFIPRAALTDIQILGVVGSPLRERKAEKPKAKEQMEMFE